MKVSMLILFKYKYGSTSSPTCRKEKLGDKIYMMNFKMRGNSNFVTIVFNFNQNVMYTSALFDPKTDHEQIFFEGRIIENVRLKEK